MRNRIPRREILKTAVGLPLMAGIAPRLFAAPEPLPRPQTFTFKQVGDLPIQADVYRPEGTGKVPVAIWIHGGALISGNRAGPNLQLTQGLLRAGCAVVSIDYRLAPETKLPEILTDIEDAYRWVRERGPELFAVDARRVAVMGGSAGGYLTLTTGYRVRPRPAALVALYGYGELTDPWYARPSELHRRRPLLSREEALATVGTAPLADGSKNGIRRMQFYLYCRQNGLWPREVSGIDPATDNKAFDPYCPQRNVTAEFPPTLLIHGTIDSDVPYTQSVQMDQELARHSVEHRLISIENAEHGFLGGDKQKIDEAYADAVAFVLKHIAPK